MIKLLGCILIIASTASVGMIAAEKLNSRVRELEQSIIMLQIICDELRYTLAPMDSILESLCANPTMQNYKLLNLYKKFTDCETFNERLIKSFNCYIGSLNKTDISLLSEITTFLGRYSAESQIASLENIIARLDFQRDE
ncbi:MAG: stage III sporulation protein AB, partial [Oscillospiraceae bacterium]